MSTFINFFTNTENKLKFLNLISSIILPSTWDKQEKRWEIGNYTERVVYEFAPQYNSQQGGFKLCPSNGHDLWWKSEYEKNLRISVKSLKNLFDSSDGLTKELSIKSTIGNAREELFLWDMLIAISRIDVNKIYSEIGFGIITRKIFDTLHPIETKGQISVKIPIEEFGSMFIQERKFFCNQNYINDITSSDTEGRESLIKALMEKNKNFIKT